MNIPWGFVGGLALWTVAYLIGPPAPIILWTIAFIGLVGWVVLLGYRSFNDPEKKSLLMWGEFYFEVEFNRAEDLDEDRDNQRSVSIEAGFKRPARHR